MIKVIKSDSKEQRFEEFAKLKTYMLKFQDVDSWKKQILKSLI